MLDHGNEKEKIVKKSRHNIGAVQLSNCMDRWVKNRQAAALRVWSSAVSYAQNQEAMIEKNKVEMAEFKAKVVADKDKTCKLLLQEFRENKAT
jgi:hypothetical protein